MGAPVNEMKNLKIAASGFIFTFALITCAAHAEETGNSDNWQFDAMLYLWGADFSGQFGPNADFLITFDDLVDNLEMGFMGSFQARKGKWSLFTDVLYLDVASDKTSVSDGIIPVTTTTSLDMSGWVIHLAGGYNLWIKEGSRLDLIAGARYMDLGSGIAQNIEILDNTGSTSFAIPLSTALDAIVGVKGQLALSKRWSLPYYLDIGTGDSDFTWQAMSGISFQAANWVDLALVYRHLEWDLGDDGSDGYIKNVNFSGPAFGAVFHF